MVNQKDGLATGALLAVVLTNCFNLYDVKCGDISDDEFRKIDETVW